MIRKESLKMIKHKMKLIDSYKTPDEWKERAGKIAQGKGIYAGVKTRSWWKAAVAAAVALALGFEGYMLLFGSNEDVVQRLDPVLVPTDSVDDELTRQYIIRQRLKNYYPGISDTDLDKLCNEYSNSGYELILTRDNGAACSSSKLLRESEAVKGVTSSGFAPECEGYVIEGDTLTALVRFTGEGVTEDNDDDPVSSSFTPHACVYSRDRNSIMPDSSVSMTVCKGVVSYYARLEVDIGAWSTRPERGFYALETDIHLYERESLGLSADTGISDTNDQRYGIYHYDIKIVPSARNVDVSSSYDAFDNITVFSSGAEYPFESYQAAWNYYDNCITTELSYESGLIDDDDKRFSPDSGTGLAMTERESGSYVKNIRLEERGMLTDGISARIFIKAKAPVREYIDDLASALEPKAYLKETGAELGAFVSEVSLYRSDDPTSAYLTIGIKPEYLLDGQTVELHLENKDQKDALHYVFTVQMPEKGARLRYTYILDWEGESADGKEYKYRTFDAYEANANTSSLGILIRHADELIGQHLDTLEQYGDMMPVAEAELEWIYPDDYIPDTMNIVSFSLALTDEYDGSAQVYRIITPDGSSFGYYFAYGEPAGRYPRAFAFEEESDAMLSFPRHENEQKIK